MTPSPSGAPRRSRPDAALLAELDADLLDEPRATAVQAAAAADPRARAVLQALATTRAQLAAAPDPPVPPDVAARWTAALRTGIAAEGHPAADASSHGPPGAAVDPSGSAREIGRSGRWARHPPVRPRGPVRRAGRRPAALARASVAVLIAGLIAVLIGVGGPTSEPGPGGGPPVAQRPALVALGRSTIGVRDSGGLEDTARRAACLRAVSPDVAAGAPLLGARRVTFEGRAGVLLVLGTGRLGTFDVVVVDPACGGHGGTLLASTRIAPP